jgi:hypothetical protein
MIEIIGAGVEADAAGEYVENSAQGSAFARECPKQRHRRRRWQAWQQ